MVFAWNATVTLTFDLLTLKSVGVIYWPCPIFLPRRMTVSHKLFKILSWHIFFLLNATVTLTFDLLISKIIGVIYWTWLIFLPSTMTVTQKLFKILSEHVFCIKCYCDLDLWHSDLKMYRGHLLRMADLPTKYHDCHSESFQDIEWKWFLDKMLLWPSPLT